MRALIIAALLVLPTLAAAADPDPCPSAAPEPLLHPSAASVRTHAFQRLPRRTGVETLRMRDGTTITLVRDGCETYGVTFDLGAMAGPADAARLRSAATAYMRRLLRIDPHFMIAREFLSLRNGGTLQGRRLVIEEGQTRFEVGPDDIEPDRLLIDYAASL